MSVSVALFLLGLMAVGLIARPFIVRADDSVLVPSARAGEQGKQIGGVAAHAVTHSASAVELIRVIRVQDVYIERLERLVELQNKQITILNNK